MISMKLATNMDDDGEETLDADVDVLLVVLMGVELLENRSTGDEVEEKCSVPDDDDNGSISKH